MEEETKYYFVQKRATPNSTASAVVRVDTRNKIEKLAGGEMINLENLEICWEIRHPIFQGCKQRLIDRFEAIDYVDYFRKKEGKK